MSAESRQGAHWWFTAVASIVALLLGPSCANRRTDRHPEGWIHVPANPVSALADAAPAAREATAASLSGGAGPCSGSSCAASPPALRFAVIGDYGLDGPAEASVAALVEALNPDFVITTGDNNYPLGSADTIDANIGQYYHSFIDPYRGTYGSGASRNRFFPSLGNHDWNTPDAQPYLDYFTLPGNERYYDVIVGPVHLFALDSDPREPDGSEIGSAQARWLQTSLEGSRSPWNVVYFHHAPYSSGPHGSSTWMRWPFAAWGASIVYSGHDHAYERFDVAGLPYIVDGVGGGELYAFVAPQPDSVARRSGVNGAVFVTATETEFVSRMVAADGEQLDELRLVKP